MNNKIIVSRETLIFAFRYSLGRCSYAPDMIIQNIKDNINNISTNDIKLYIKEINECQNYGMHMDEQSWMDFKNYLELELKKRENNDIVNTLLNDDDIMYCHICRTPMDWIRQENIKDLGICNVCICPECRKIIYCPINKYKRKEDENNE